MSQRSFRMRSDGKLRSVLANAVPQGLHVTEPGAPGYGQQRRCQVLNTAAFAALQPGNSSPHRTACILA